MYSEGTLSIPAARKWFARFHSGNFNAKDDSRSGRPISEKADEILEIEVQQDRHISSVDISMELGIDHKTVLNYLQKAGYKKKLDIWVPHELSVKNMIDRINICDALRKRNEIETFLKRVISGDEKWITYNDQKCKDHG